MGPVDFQEGMDGLARAGARHWGQIDGGVIYGFSADKRAVIGSSCCSGTARGSVLACKQLEEEVRSAGRPARWRDAASTASAIVGAAGGPRLGAGARGENAGVGGGFVITIICEEERFILYGRLTDD